MANSLSEGFVRLTYSNPYGVHHAMFPVNYDGTPTPGTEPTVTLKDATTEGLVTAFAAFMVLYKVMFDSDVLFGLAEAYAVDAETEERTFLYGWNVGIAGTSAGSITRDNMVTLTFKTVGGGVLKVVMMETNLTTGLTYRPPFAVDSPWEDLASFIVSGESFLIGRDNTYPFAPISLKSKESDALRARHLS